MLLATNMDQDVINKLLARELLGICGSKHKVQCYLSRIKFIILRLIGLILLSVYDRLMNAHELFSINSHS